MRTSTLTTRNIAMLVVALFVTVVAGSVFSESDLHRLPKISERSTAKTEYKIFDPCATDKTRNRNLSCAQIQLKGENESSEYEIRPNITFNVRCDMKTDGGGWTVIQRRSEYEYRYRGDQFEKSDQQYEDGFQLTSGYWIGNENLYALTNYPNNPQALKIELTKQNGEKITVDYGSFRVGSKKDEYRLYISDLKGPKGADNDALTPHNGARFTTKMGTNGGSRRGGCKKLQSGGWWFKEWGCDDSNLNGRKLEAGDPDISKGLGITWHKKSDRNSDSDAYLTVEMKIRNADFQFCMGLLTYDMLGSIHLS